MTVLLAIIMYGILFMYCFFKTFFSWSVGVATLMTREPFTKRSSNDTRENPKECAIVVFDGLISG